MDAEWADAHSDQGPDLASSQVHVWLVDLDGAGRGLEEALMPEERRRAAQRLSPSDARRWARSRAALRRILAGYLGVRPRAIEFVLGADGKPSLAGARRLRFNASHSGSLSLVAVSLDREVGVDVEKVRAGLDEDIIARRVFGAEALRVLESAESADRAATFLRLWVRHEASGKCRGSGIEASPRGIGGVTIEDIDVGDGYFAALALEPELDRRGAERRPHILRLRWVD